MTQIDAERVLTRVTEYLTREVLAVEATGYAWCKCLKHGQRIYDVTDAALIVMARYSEMQLDRIRHQETRVTRG